MIVNVTPALVGDRYMEIQSQTLAFQLRELANALGTGRAILNGFRAMSAYGPTSEMCGPSSYVKVSVIVDIGGNETTYEIAAYSFNQPYTGEPARTPDPPFAKQEPDKILITPQPRGRQRW